MTHEVHKRAKNLKNKTELPKLTKIALDFFRKDAHIRFSSGWLKPKKKK